MRNWIKITISQPTFLDGDKTFATSLLNTILFCVLFGAILYAIVSPIHANNIPLRLLYVGFVVGLSVVLFYFTHRGYILFPSIAIVAGIWLLLVVACFASEGVKTPAYGGLFLTILMAGLLLGLRAALVTAISSTLVGVLLLFTHANGFSTTTPSALAAVSMWVAQTVFFLVTAVLLHLTLRVISKSLTQAQHEIAERKRAEEALRLQSERLKVFHEIDQGILAAQSSEDIANASLKHIHTLVACYRAVIVLFDFQQGLVIPVAENVNGVITKRQDNLTIEEFGIDAMLWKGQAFIKHHLTAETAVYLSEKRILAQGVLAYIDVPLIAGGELIGALCVGSKEPAPFQTSEVGIVREVADQIAIAIWQSRLAEQIKQYSSELEDRVTIRTKELAEANERLKELDKLKTKFISDVSHELRTPVATLQLYLDLLGRGKTEKYEHYMNVVRQQCDRLNQLVGDVLDLSLLELGQERITFGPVNLNSLVQEIASFYEPRTHFSNISLHFTPDPSLPPVLGEVAQISQVVSNLVDNALNYTTAGYIKISTYCAENKACLKIEDSGIGIEADDLPYVFDRFYRGKRVMTMNLPGTGLGLGIVKEIVTLHGGTIQVQSEAGKGSTFWVCLPFAV